jgi:TetR/AcrR family tetracycline transcriptional repressor
VARPRSSTAPSPPALWSPARPGRDRLTREQVVQAALALLDQFGLGGLTMRQLAQRLGIQSPSLYWHVRDKEELLALVADELCAAIELPPTHLPWRDQLQAMAWNFRAVLRAHRDAALLLASTLPFGPNRLGQAERMLSLLVQAGFGPRAAARIGLLCTDYVTNAVIEEQRQVAMASTEADGLAGIQSWFATLPADQYPTLVSLAPHLTEDDADGRFQFGLHVLLRGLEEPAEQHRA